YAALLDGLLDACGVGRAVILGNSIGGAAAIRYAAARPERVSALVLENPGGLHHTHDPLARTVIRALVAVFHARAPGASWVPCRLRGVLPARAPARARPRAPPPDRRLGGGDRPAAARRLDRIRRAGRRRAPPGARHPLPGADRLGDERSGHPAAALSASAARLRRRAARDV